MWTCKTCNRVNKLDDGQCEWCCAYNSEYVSSLENKIDSLESELAELRKEHSQYKKIYENIHAIIDETDGVSGYHLNGEIADWDEFIDDLLLKTTQ